MSGIDACSRNSLSPARCSLLPTPYCVPHLGDSWLRRLHPDWMGSPCRRWRRLPLGHRWATLHHGARQHLRLYLLLVQCTSWSAGRKKLEVEHGRCHRLHCRHECGGDVLEVGAFGVNKQYRYVVQDFSTRSGAYDSPDSWKASP